MSEVEFKAIVKHRGSWEKTCYEGLEYWDIEENALCLTRLTQVDKDSPVITSTFIIPMNLIECAEICSVYKEETEKKHG